MKTTQIKTSIPLKPFFIHKWRGAIIEQVLQHQKAFEAANIPTDVFHNHNEKKWNDPNVNQERNRMSRYPLIQYTCVDGKAGIMGIGKGADALRLLSDVADAQITINGQQHLFETEELTERTQRFEMQSKTQRYILREWIPFNPARHEEWRKTTRLAEQATLADRALFGNFFHLMDALEQQVDRKQLVLHASNIIREQYVDCFRIKKLALDVEIVTNCTLPLHFGLGQGATLGFGRIEPIHSKKHTKHGLLQPA